MAHAFEKVNKEFIDKLVGLVKNNFDSKKSQLVEKFIRIFYGTIAIEDLETHALQDLYGAALSFWDFISQRNEGQTKVRIYNPDFETNGWSSTHTVVEIITDDMPFLVDSLLMEINRRHLTSHLVVHCGGMKVKRDAKRKITDLQERSMKSSDDYVAEAPIYLEIDRITDQKQLDEIKESIEKVFDDVRASVEDWPAMKARLRKAIDELKAAKEFLDEEEFNESVDFLNWIDDNHFTFTGVRDYELKDENGEKVLVTVPKTGLGVLRDDSTSRVSRRLASMTPEARRLTLSNQTLIISKTNTESTIHRPAYTDYIGIKRFDAKGKVIGECRLVGLYTAEGYTQSPRHIPFLRRKVDTIMEMSGIAPGSHAGKVLLNILETLPRDDLFQGTHEELLDMSMGILHMQERRRIRMFARKDIYGRFISCLVYVPRDRFNTELRQSMQQILEREFHATSSTFTTQFSESVLARIHFTLRTDPAHPVPYDYKKIEEKIIEVARLWNDDLVTQLVEFFGEEKGNALAQRYAVAFPASYRESFAPRTALYDIKHIINLKHEDQLELNFYKPVEVASNVVKFKVYQFNHPMPLSDALPILENMGLRVQTENPYEITFDDKSSVWINDFAMYPHKSIELDDDSLKEKFQQAFSAVWFGDAENDGFNQLVLGAGLTWREITILRAYAKYVRQTGFTFSQNYIEQCMINNSHISSQLVKLFMLRFDTKTAAKNAAAIESLETEIQENIDSVVSLDDDRILRRYHDLIKATLRTNYFQTREDGSAKQYLSFKFNPALIPDLPQPRPKFEIFVYSPRFEGVHLRGSSVARGGIRWSDRREDFRTEVLGLMKAQQVKNAVIVPSGAKGGFIPKCMKDDFTREQIMDEGIACYRNFIRGLLDLTDNVVGDAVVPPTDVYRYDEDDPYLVVAADKGTATFSDIANSISQEYQFWLGDAFASGGSAGYDHKKMGITAKGAWESVKRHFRELGRDIQTSDFTCVGIGDMSGDVFGNGMLLSRHTKLLAAFNHLHIFVDPNPNPETTFDERQRLFNLPRSSWSDFDAKLISKGGGVFNRKDKSVVISPEMKAVFSITADRLTPNDLIKAILCSSFDLLWNGGIGTFVKGVNERHNEVGDRTNDAIRVSSNELRCKVVGEGGNLGFTQQARVEYALLGGLNYTDAIDNSGGVDCSDHEVNIKILLNQVMVNGDMTLKQRNELLAKMTDEVAQLVLYHNYQQTQAISLAAFQAPQNIELHARYIVELEKTGNLNRALEFLPDEQALSERKMQNKGLTRPGIAVLLAYSKILLKRRIIDSDVPEDPYLSRFLELAFPQPLREKYKQAMSQHKLRREIIATQLSNRLVNEMGFSFTYRLFDETGAPDSAIMRAYIVTRSIFNIEDLWKQIEALDNKVPAEQQINLMLKLIRLTRRTTRWFLKNRRMHLDIAEAIEEFKPGVQQIKQYLPDVLMGEDLKSFMLQVDSMQKFGVPSELALELAMTETLLSSLDIIEACREHHFNIHEYAQVYFSIDDQLELGWIRKQILEQHVESHWDALSREALRDDLDNQQRHLTIAIMKFDREQTDLRKRFASWMQHFDMLIQRWHSILTDLRSSPSINSTMFFVAIRELMDLTQTSLQVASSERLLVKQISKPVPKGKATVVKVINKKSQSK